MKRGEHPSSRRRHRKQKVKEAYSKAREDAQLSGVIPTEPAGAVRDEQVDPATQSEAPQTGLIVQALRNGWEVPEERKPRIVDELLDIIEDSEMPSKAKIAAFNALRMADQQQYERDHPERAGQAKGGSARGGGGSVVNNFNGTVHTGDVFNDINLIERSIRQIQGLTDAEAVGDVRADGDAQPVDGEEPGPSEEEPEAD